MRADLLELCGHPGPVAVGYLLGSGRHGALVPAYLDIYITEAGPVYIGRELQSILDLISAGHEVYGRPAQEDGKARQGLLDGAAHLQQEAAAVFGGAAVFVRPVVRGLGKEAVERAAGAGHELHAVPAALFEYRGGVDGLGDVVRHLLLGHGDVLLAVYLSDGDVRRAVCLFLVAAGGAPVVQRGYLSDEVRTVFVNHGRHLRQALDMFFSEGPGYGVAGFRGLRIHHHGLADEIEASRRALFKVVEEHLRGHMRDAVRVSQARGHRRGHHAVPEPETSDVYRGQQVLVF